MPKPTVPRDTRPAKVFLGWVVRLGLAACLPGPAWGQPTPPAAAPAPPAALTAPPPAAPAPPAAGARPALDGPAAQRHLNVAVSWYRHATTDIPVLGLPSEVLYQDQVHSLAAQVVKLAFQSARSEADLLHGQEAQAEAQASGGAAAAQRRALAEARTTARVQDLQARVADLEARLAGTPAARRAEPEILLERVKSQLDLQQALLEAIRKMKAFADNNGDAAGGMRGSIDQLARSIPEVLGQAADPGKPASPAVAHPPFSSSGGLLSQLGRLYDCMNSERQITSIMQRTDRLRELADKVRDPLRSALRATIQESQALADKPPAADGTASLQAETLADRALTDRFKQLSGTLLPISQEVMLLEDFNSNLGRWRDLVKRASGFVLRAVLIRVAIILLALAVILILSEAWRRVAFRYVKEPRRRRQFLVLRRVVAGFLIAIVLILGFVTEFSSLATFAGFITAGIAVGLQAVLLSVAAYFLIIGRYGIRVGDRITIAGITGDVVDVGLVRFYLMELAGTGLDFRPTGRIVVFSNAVLFQAGTPLFKQIPGTEYTWHELVLMVAPEGDHPSAQDKVLAAVNEVFAEHRPEFERQHEAIERRGDIQVEAPLPEARLQFADGGLELLVRYPVAIRKGMEMDEQVTRKVLGLIAADPELKAVVVGTPKTRSPFKG